MPVAFTCLWGIGLTRSMLSKIRILQIGDVHLPTAAQAMRNVDQKDKAFSVELRNIISSVPTKVVFKQIYKLLDDGGVDAILFMGDLTDRGHLDNYRRASAFLANALQIGEGRNHGTVAVGIVPGNHDINRELAKQPGLATKFMPLNDHLIASRLPVLPSEQTISLSVTSGQAALDINLMNSCWGCGASEYIPAEFRDGIGRAIEASIAKGGAEALQTYYDRQFDTPAFANDSIEEIVQRASAVDPNALLVVAAHHNLLPQRLTRLAPYTELVNSGTLRASLMAAGRPVVYLHGHIHEDPIEIMAMPAGEAVISISAPAAENGFNLLEFNFTRSGLPLSCNIYPWRFSGAGILHRAPTITVPLIGRRRRSHDATLAKIYAHLMAKGECYWSELATFAASLFAADIDDNLREALELLVADDSVALENYQLDPSNWIVRAKI